MQITENDIDSVEEHGMLDGAPIKIIRTKGGLVMAVGKLRGKPKDEVLTAGSHIAIVRYNLEKAYPQYQLPMMKSEGMEIDPIVDKHSHFLSDDLRKSGHDIFSIQTGNEIDFHVTKFNNSVSHIKGSMVGGDLILSRLNTDKQFVRGLAGATTEKAVSLKAAKIKVAVK